MTDTLSPPRATVEDLHRFPDGKYELIGGRIKESAMPGDGAARIAGNVYFHLRLHVTAARRGHARADGTDYALEEPLTSGRQSFRPDASYYDRPPPSDWREFVSGAPDFAVEVRSASDYGDAADVRVADKIADYFEAGTVCVWDVDPAARTVTLHRADRPDRPQVFRPGESAHAEPAVPGWSVPVAEVFG